MRKEKVSQFFEKYTAAAASRNRIPAELYAKYEVKRGLRNADGTGVLVGLTDVGQVRGYVIEDGHKIPAPGKLSYRGIDVKDIVKGFQDEGRFGFEETVFLLIFGTLPTARELEDICTVIGELRPLPTNFAEDTILKAPSRSVMNKLARAILTLYSFDPEPESIEIANLIRQSIELISRIPAIIAYAYQAKNHYFNGESLYLHSPDPSASTAENFLKLIRSDQAYTPLEAETLDLSLVLHAEHGGGNNSTFCTHVVSSTGTDSYAALSAAVGSLKGPLHGGASNMVHEMMLDAREQIRDWTDEEETAAYVSKLLNKQAFDRKGLVYGLGHAVYTLSDPRAELLKIKAEELAKAAGREKEFQLYSTIEKITPKLFTEVTGKHKELCANVDFYSGFVYDMLRIPADLFTPIFAASRIAGWCAHRVEEIVSGGRILRPAYRSITRQHPYMQLAQRDTENAR